MKIVNEKREKKIKVTHQIPSVTNCQINWIKKERTTTKKGTQWRHRRDKKKIGKITYTSHSAQTVNFRHLPLHCSPHMNNFRPSYVKHFATLANGC